MPANRIRLAVLALVALFLFGLVWILNLAIARAPVFGEHSTMRADPLGAKALYETLAAIPGVRVERNLRRAGRLAGVKATVFWIGSPAGALLGWQKQELASFEAIVRGGGRLVLGVLPTPPAMLQVQPKGAPLHNITSEMEKRWQLRIERQRVPKSEEPSSEMARQTSLWLVPLTAEWKCLEERDSHCLAVERAFGTGTIVITLETFPLSNQGLREKRRPAWIATLVGPWQRVIFDETHLGVQESGSVGTLIRQFRLEAAALMLVALAALFIWRNAASFLPARPLAPDLGLAADAHRSMVLLLRRSIAPEALAAACLDEWQRARPLLPYRQRRRVTQAMAAARTATSPAAAWQRVRQALQEKS